MRACPLRPRSVKCRNFSQPQVGLFSFRKTYKQEKRGLLRPQVLTTCFVLLYYFSHLLTIRIRASVLYKRYTYILVVSMLYRKVVTERTVTVAVAV